MGKEGQHQAISANFTQICSDLFDELGYEEYKKLRVKHWYSGEFTARFTQAWCDLGDEGWAVE